MENKMIFNPIGSVFMEGNAVLKVVEKSDYSNCEGCWYAHKNKDTGLKNYNGYGETYVAKIITCPICLRKIEL